MGLSSKERVKLCDGSEISPGDDVLVLWQDSSKRTAWRRARLIRVCQGASAFLGVYELSDGKRIIRTRYSVKRKPKRACHLRRLFGPRKSGSFLMGYYEILLPQLLAEGSWAHFAKGEAEQPQAIEARRDRNCEIARQ